MKFNVSKCHSMRVTRLHPSRHIDFNYTLHQQTLEQVQSAKYLRLGLTITDDLDWGQHISEITCKATKTLGFLRRNLALAPRHTKEVAYKTLVRPQLEYAAPIWHPYQKKIRKEIQRGKETVLNLSRKTLSDAEYRLLGKGLKYCPKPKSHDKIQLKQDVFEFSRKLRLREFFNAKNSEENDSEPNACENNFDYIKRNSGPKSTFVPPSGRDTSLDFYIDSITNEILQNEKKYKFTPNLSPEELEALKQLRSDNSIVIKKADKGSTVVIMNRDDYIAEVERQLNN